MVSRGMLRISRGFGSERVFDCVSYDCLWRGCQLGCWRRQELRLDKRCCVVCERCFRLILNLRRWRNWRGDFFRRGFFKRQKWLRCGRGRGEFCFGHLRRSCETFFVLGFECSENQLRQQSQATHVAVVESERLGRESFQKSDHAPPPAQRHCDHRPRAQLPARIEVYTIVGLGVVAADNLRGAETCSGESRVALNALAYIGLYRTRRGPQNNFVVLGQGDSQSIGSGDGDRSFRYQLQHFVENELLSRLELRRRRDRFKSIAPRGQRPPLPYLLMQRRERQKRLQGIAS